MKGLLPLPLLIAHCSLTIAQTANVGIGTTTPDPSALLHIESTERGVLVPRLSALQRMAVAEPANGLLVYDTDSACFYFYNALLPAWQNLCAGGAPAPADGQAWLITGNSGTDTAHFLGTVDSTDLHLRVNDRYAGRLTATGDVFMGQDAGRAAEAGSGLIAIGRGAMRFSTGGAVNRIAIGDSALYQYTSHPFGYNDIAIGSKALFSSLSGHNIAVGHWAMMNATEADMNTAIGLNALAGNTVGSYNTAIGSQALMDNISSYYNTAIGAQAMQHTQGEQNTAVGGEAMSANTVGAYNTSFGAFSGNFIVSTDNNTCIGAWAGSVSNGPCPCSFADATYVGAFTSPVDGAGYSNQTVVGFLGVGTASHQVRLGNTAVTSIGGFAGWTNVSDGRFKRNVREDVPGLALIGKLRPVSYTLDVETMNRHLGVPDSLADHGALRQKSALRMTGLIAQEVERAAQELGYDHSAVDAPKGERDIYGLRYAELVPSLIRALQEQQEMIARLEQRMARLDGR